MEVPEIPDMASSKDFAATNFSQVIFPEISDYFPPGKDVQVVYVLTEAMEPSSRDWVGLFKVGWTSAREYVTFVWAPKLRSPEENNRTVWVKFTAYYLPTDKNEFYQFCYVTKQGLIRGASTPFQFRESSECDQLIEVEDESGMIVLKTKSAALQEQLELLTTNKQEVEVKLNDITTENSKLSSNLSEAFAQLDATKAHAHIKEEDCKRLETELAETQKNLDDVNTKLKVVEEEMSKQSDELDQANKTISEVTKEALELNEKLVQTKEGHAEEISSLRHQLDAKVQQLTELECKVHDLTENIKTSQLQVENLQQKANQSSDEVEKSTAGVRKERDAALAKASRYKEEKELFKDQFTHSEEARRDIMQQLTHLKDKMQHKDAEIQEKVEKLLVYEEKTKMLKNELKDVSKSNVVQKTTMESELSNMEDKLNACEASKRLLSNELTEARDNRDKLMSELHQTKKEKAQILLDLEASRRQLSEMEKNYLSMKERAERGEQRFTEKERKLTDERVFIKEQEIELREQIEILKSQLESADMAVAAAASSDEKEKYESGTQTTSAKMPKDSTDRADGDLGEKDRMISDLKLQLEDLHTRLSMGAKAYTEKYMECHKLEKKMKKIQIQKSSVRTPAAIQQLEAVCDSATSDSQDDSAKGASASVGTKQVAKDTPMENLGDQQQSAGGNFMSKLEQLFIAIADPDLEEKEQSNRLKARLQELEKNVQAQHSKYRKYKKLYQEEKLSHAADHEKSRTEALSLKTKLEDLQDSKMAIEHENEALKEQVKEFMKNSRDENVIRTRKSADATIPAPPGETFMYRYGNPYLEDPIRSSSSGSYPHDILFPGQDPSAQNDSGSESDSSDDFQLANGRFVSPLGLCPKNQMSDDSDPLNMSRSPPDQMAPASGVIKRQPTRSPPLIEVISGDGEDNGEGVLPSGPTPNKRGARQRKAGKSKKSGAKHDYA